MKYINSILDIIGNMVKLIILWQEQGVAVPLVDNITKVSDDEALNMLNLIAVKEGLIVGSSSGAALVAAIKLGETIKKGNIVVILPGRGDRYFSKNIYN